jgi:hypothetical protein
MKRTIAAGTVLLAVGLLAQLALAAPASAAGQPGPPPPPTTTCSQASCSVGIGQFITLHGDVGQNGGNVGTIALAPLPCIWDDVGNQITGSQTIILIAREIVHMLPSPDVEQLQKQLAPFVKQAQALIAAGKPDGNWYDIIPNTGDTMAQMDSCNNYPLFEWVPTGTVPPFLPQVPAKYLAEYAFNHMQLPKPRVHVSPARKGIVNLASFVWATWRRQMADTPAQYIDATLGPEAATVWAQPLRLALSVRGPGDVSDNCSVSDTGPGKLPVNAGPGVKPDCGVLWTGTDTGATITVSVQWYVTWYDTLPAGPHGAPVPGTQDGIVTTTRTYGPIPIYSVQSINNG